MPAHGGEVLNEIVLNIHGGEVLYEIVLKVCMVCRNHYFDVQTQLTATSQETTAAATKQQQQEGQSAASSNHSHGGRGLQWRTLGGPNLLLMLDMKQSSDALKALAICHINIGMTLQSTVVLFFVQWPTFSS